MREIALTIGVFVLGFGLRSFGAVAARKAGAMVILCGSFLGGYFLGGGSVASGLFSTGIWFFLPWIEILGRVRHVRLPMRREITPCRQPAREEFPMLGQLTGEIEDCGFTQGEDVGWAHGEFSQFMRLFQSPDSRVQATLSLSRQSGHAFAFVALSTRSGDGRLFRTTNLPFSDTMAAPPDQYTQRHLTAQSFAELASSHELFLSRAGVGAADRVEVRGDQALAMLEHDVARQIEHNLQRGLITPADAGTFRYSWRGFVFLWWRLVGDMVRLA